MNKNIKNRVQNLANHIILTHQTVRQTACVYGISKSTVHNDVSCRLKNVDFLLYERVKKILEKNFEEKHIRGGESTRKKYLKK